VAPACRQKATANEITDNQAIWATPSTTSTDEDGHVTTRWGDN